MHLCCFDRTKKIEKLMLQQNEIKRICDAFKQLIKLKELRLDRNRLTSVENLVNCGALKILDLSYNHIASLEVRSSHEPSFTTIRQRSCRDYLDCSAWQN